MVQCNALELPVWLGMSIAQVFALRVLVVRVGGGERAEHYTQVYVLLAFGMFLAALRQSVAMHAVYYRSWHPGVQENSVL